MKRVVVRNVLGEEMSIFAGWKGDSKWAWGRKFLTKNCLDCSYYIGKEEAIVVLQKVDAFKGRIKWSPPSNEEVMGLCDWGIWTKILVPREKKLRKCEYFGRKPF